ncbi:uncharacterized protein HMPREF1541_10445, partial [Cyphellophora europaea CBS 101466]
WEVIVPQASCSNPKFIMRHEILNLLEAGQTPGTGFLLVDVRREDHQGSSIAGSVNMPIQTLFQSLPTLIRICIGGKIDRVIFYCGHSTGRGPRAAALFNDEIKRNKLEGQIQSLVLTEGFNGWSTAGEAFDK